MRCDNCRAKSAPAFTLAAYPSGGDDPVIVDFCSIDCLQVWTACDGGNVGRWRWGTHDADGEEAREADGEEAREVEMEGAREVEMEGAREVEMEEPPEGEGTVDEEEPVPSPAD